MPASSNNFTVLYTVAMLILESSFVNKIDLYGFNSGQVIDQNYAKIIDLFNKGVLIKNLIKPNY